MRALLVTIVLGILAAMTVATPASAQDHERARGAVQAGEIRPLSDILAAVRNRYPGRLLDADLKQQGRSRWLYQLKLLQSDGRVVAVTVDARTGQVLGAKGQRPNGGGGNRGRPARRGRN